MADDNVDISGMPDPGSIGLSPAAQSDPTDGMPEPRELFAKHYGYSPKSMNPSKEELDEFMANPPEQPHKYTAREVASGLTGVPRAVAGYGLAVPAAVASIAGQGIGALGAALDPENAGTHLEQGRERGRELAAKTNNLANYIPATKQGGEFAEGALNVPAGAIKETVGAGLKAMLPDNAYQAVSDVAQDVGTDLPALGVPAYVRGIAKVGGKIVKAVKGAPVPTPYAPLVPPVGAPVSGNMLRAQPNPIPPPEGTQAHARSVANQPAAESQPAAPEASTAAAEPAEGPTPQAAATPRPAAGDVPPTGDATLPESDTAPLDMSLSPDERAVVREGIAARRAASESQRGSVRLFNEPAKEGPQGQSDTTPDERTGHLDALDKLSGGGLPTRRTSAITGDYDATGHDFQMKEVGSQPMVEQLKTENAALHKGAENIHQSIDSGFDNSVDQQTLEDRGRTTRGALQGIEKHFGDMTDAVYNQARATHGTNPMPEFLKRAEGFLGDEANYMPDGFRRSAQARLKQLQTVGDNGDGTPNSGATPSSVGAAEKFREWLNKNRTMDNAHVVKQLKDHVDTDVSEQGGPGLFKTARNMRQHQAQMLEEPKLVSQLLTATDSQGINHQIPTNKVMDRIADAPSEQVEHLMKVLHAGAHLSPELAESSAAAIREIQAHMVSRMHDAATNADGTWNARTFHNAANRYSTKVSSVFKDRPDIVQNLQTLNKAGNTLSMDKHYPGAFGQEAKTSALGHALETGGKFASGLAHDVPFVGRIVGRAMENAVEGLGGRVSESSRDKAVAKRLVDRTGKQRGSVGVLPQRDAIEHERNPPGTKWTIPEGGAVHRYSVPNNGGSLEAVEYPEFGVTKVRTSGVENKGQGWGTRMLQRAADDAHARGQVLRSDDRVSEGQAGAYKNLATLGYNVVKKPADLRGGAYKSVGDHVFEVRPKALKVPSGQRGSFSFQNDNALNRATSASRSRQSGAAERNPRSEYNANRNIAGNPAESAERAEVLRRILGQQNSAPVKQERRNQ